MKSKEKSKGDNRARGIAKPKIVSVAEGSLQSRAPGYVMPGGPDTQFPRTNTGSQQSELNRGHYAGLGAQQAGWSARQQGQRMQARGEQDRMGQAQQSGAGMEQQQRAGSQESTVGSHQTGSGASVQGSAGQPSSDYGSKPNRKSPRG